MDEIQKFLFSGSFANFLLGVRKFVIQDTSSVLSLYFEYGKIYYTHDSLIIVIKSGKIPTPLGFLRFISE